MTFRLASAAGIALVLTTFSLAATAGDVRVRCEKRSNRSSVSVDGSDLAPGSYKAVVKSGGVTYTSAFDTALDDEVEFDFDSNRGDIAEGAVAIPAGFIVNGRVKGWIVNASNQRATPVSEVGCRIRRK